MKEDQNVWKSETHSSTGVGNDNTQCEKMDVTLIIKGFWSSSNKPLSPFTKYQSDPIDPVF